jgi:hypothetical protein
LVKLKLMLMCWHLAIEKLKAIGKRLEKHLRIYLSLEKSKHWLNSMAKLKH